MTFKRNYQISILVIISIIVNYAGRAFADHFSLPLWLDSIGTVFMAYVAGPASGAIVGVTMNILYSSVSVHSWLYGLTSIAIGCIVGFCARRRMFETLFGTITVSVLVTLAAIFVSLPINIFFSDGMTGNVWGDGVIGWLLEQSVPEFLCSLIGQFYTDFFDKVITLVVLYAMIHIYRFIKNLNTMNLRKRLLLKYLDLLYKIKHIRNIFCIAALLALPALVSSAAGRSGAGSLHASPRLMSGEELNSYVQTIYSRDNGLPCGEANSIVQTNDGILWIGTYAGLYRYNGSEFQLMHQFESVRSVNTLYVDEEGRMWIGTNGNGLSIMINEKISNVVSSANGLPSDSVRSIVKSSDGLYYVATSKGVQVLSINTGMRILNTIDTGYTNCITADKSGNIAALNSSGTIFIIRDKKLVSTHEKQGKTTKDFFNTCTFSTDGTLYCGTTKNRICSFRISEDGELIKIKESNVPLNCVNGIFPTEDKLFLCTDTGIGYMQRDGSFYTVNTPAFNNSIDTMTADYQGNLWFTSSRQGVLKLSNSSFVNLYNQIGLSQKMVNRLHFGMEARS